jgi:superfamily II DNA or RNA helicase
MQRIMKASKSFLMSSKARKPLPFDKTIERRPCPSALPPEVVRASAVVDSHYRVPLRLLTVKQVEFHCNRNTIRPFAARQTATSAAARTAMRTATAAAATTTMPTTVVARHQCLDGVYVETNDAAAAADTYVHYALADGCLVVPRVYGCDQWGMVDGDRDRTVFEPWTADAVFGTDGGSGQGAPTSRKVVIDSDAEDDDDLMGVYGWTLDDEDLGQLDDTDFERPDYLNLVKKQQLRIKRLLNARNRVPRPRMTADEVWRFNGTLECKPRRPQQEAVAAAKAHLARARSDMCALISLPCGDGKTVTLLGLLADPTLRPRCTVIFVHKIDLMSQWIERINQYLPNVRVGTIHQDVQDIDGCEIVIAMIQTVLVRKLDPSHLGHVGCVVVDEAHHIAARSFSHVLDQFRARVRIGLTATPYRGDGATQAIFWHVGNMCFEAKRIWQPVAVRVMQFTPSPDAEAASMHVSRDNHAEYARLKRALAEDPQRNECIVDQLTEALRNPNEHLCRIAVVAGGQTIEYMLEPVSTGVAEQPEYLIRCEDSDGRPLAPTLDDGAVAVDDVPATPTPTFITRPFQTAAPATTTASGDDVPVAGLPVPDGPVSLVRPFRRHDKFLYRRVAKVVPPLSAAVPRRRRIIVLTVLRDHIDTLNSLLQTSWVKRIRKEARERAGAAGGGDDVQARVRTVRNITTVTTTDAAGECTRVRFSVFTGAYRSEQERTEAKQCDVIFSTFSMANEALDICELDTVFLVMPRSDVDQTTGRVMRICLEKNQPMIFDVSDTYPDLLADQAQRRHNFYVRNDWALEYRKFGSSLTPAELAAIPRKSAFKRKRAVGDRQPQRPRKFFKGAKGAKPTKL